ncbi:phosphatase [Rhizobium anhuiense]|uniref:Phosphatase n=1 Tax=Rhizobium anhuiense TaxID=1184720 RepID=A0A3S0RZ94_9HYPH|nr:MULTISPECIES: HAD family phosphatase [Rhizobium]MBB3298847.1 beta-phosphoglucomutase-like phosphatase (HAD superfamily) [Rhizobium sp. BK112]MBB3367245.1 beta-phosphoglucomutase-like phosphatase (HAD superfamily) [Rhizobium sp. BK077]MBB3742073.1 beta-phosphoglucomutase-like phosphatase (HAD superfamily) [Rhizobium sp. BK591]MBB4111907.1 beta-phosphoglucomutase-like phosphatase (HAD superfamily) [Rhizobium sp. BK226]MBB4178739.1 beta-phosphoglucomutase-like phosphatase (HAD superfamily) [Rh
MIDILSLENDFEAVIFDCDGTLVHTPPVYADAWAAGFAHSGKPMNQAWYLMRAGMSEGVLMEAFEREFDVVLDRESVIATMRSHFLQNLHRVREVHVVAATVRRLAGVRPMAVASGGSREIVTATLHGTGLREYFDELVTIDDVANPKPAPDLFLQAAALLGIEPARCVVFEDSEQGLEAARRAGMSAIDVNRLDLPEQQRELNIRDSLKMKA